MRDFTLVSYKMIRVDHIQFDTHFWFSHYVWLCLKTNWSDLSFTVHKFEKSNVQWNVFLSDENVSYKHTEGE